MKLKRNMNEIGVAFITLFAKQAIPGLQWQEDFCLGSIKADCGDLQIRIEQKHSYWNDTGKVFTAKVFWRAQKHPAIEIENSDVNSLCQDLIKEVAEFNQALTNLKSRAN